MAARISVVVVDDHPVVREGLEFLLSAQPDFDLVGSADSGAGLLALLKRVVPDVLVLDLTLRGTESLPLIRELRASYPGLRILVLSMHDELLYAEQLLGLGVRGYVMKQEPPTEFLRALRRVAAGEQHVSPAVEGRMAARGAAGDPGCDPLAQFTARELEILQLLARGYGTQEIADTLGMSPKTVDSHRRNMRDKLGIDNPRDLVRYASRWADQAAARARG